MTTLRKNDLIDIDITGMTAQGAGVGHWEGMAVFTPLTAPGDRARVRVVKVAKSYAFGRLEELLSPSPDRVEPDCPCFAQCGGCCYRHIRYEAELKIKEARVRDALERIGGFSGLPMRPILGAPSRDGYRNKALLPLGVKKDGSLSMGFYAVNSHRIVDCQRCLLQPEEFNRAMEAFRQWAAEYGDPVYDEGSHSGKMRRLYLRMGEQSGQVLACVVVNGNGLHHEQELVEQLKAAVPGLASVVINSNRERTNVALGKKCRTIYGTDTIEDRLCGLRFQLSPLSFYQVNRGQAERLYGLAGEYAQLTGEELLLDLYCGAGTIGLSLAGKAPAAAVGGAKSSRRRWRMPGKTPNSTALRTGSSSAGTRRRLPKCWPSEASGRTSLCWTHPGRGAPRSWWRQWLSSGHGGWCTSPATRPRWQGI